MALFLNPVFNFAQLKGKYYPLLQEKILPMFYLLERDTVVSKVISSTKSYRILSDSKWNTFIKAVNNDCKINSICFLDLIKYDSASIENFTQVYISALKQQPSALQRFVAIMRSSSSFSLMSDSTDEALFRYSLINSYKALNNLLTNYITNKGFIYPNIDSAIYQTNSFYYNQLIAEILTAYAAYNRKPNLLDFEVPIMLAMSLLEINNRDESIRFEPLSKVNASAYSKVPSLKWSDYEYSSILVLGEGPEMDNIALSQHAKLRCRIASQEFKLKRAPFIVVSGGFVHPFNTKYCEAVEMRKFLVQDCGIPNSAIIIEPYARHTTTNIRNTNRIIYKNNIPPNKKILCISSRSHIDYIQSERFVPRCLQELGYIPFRQMKRLDLFKIEFLPEKLSLTINSFDPLDP